jgi:membrane-bound lytic murein transglycosylase D
MSTRKFITALLLFFCFILPSYASETVKETGESCPVLSSLTEEKLKYSPKIVEDFSYNELAVNAVQKHILVFSEKIKERFSLYLVRSGRYLDMMKEILKERNVPEEIVFLPLIESGFNPLAYSRARAVGYWQFIASTARKYGLEINWWKDERRDPVKSTRAAANYLKDLYDMFGSWNLAMAAYNAGEGKISRALNRTRSYDYWDLLKTNQIKRETKEYVPKFIAASLIANRPEDFGFDDLEMHPPLNYDTVTVETPVDIKVIAECAETTEEVIRELNPELRRWCTPPDVFEYTLRIPEGKEEIFLENLSQKPEEERLSVDIYTVRKGDSFYRISKKTGIPLQVIFDLNDIEKIMPLKAGAKLFLPPKGKFVLDRDDRLSVKKASYKYKPKKKTKKKKI